MRGGFFITGCSELEGRYIECTFGILSNKWRMFHTTILTSPDFAIWITKAVGICACTYICIT